MQFSPRKTQILFLLATYGESDHTIAKRLGLSKWCVTKALAEVKDELGLKNRTEVAVWAWRTYVAPFRAAYTVARAA